MSGLLLSILVFGAIDDSTHFESARYGVRAELPFDWIVRQREQEDRVFVISIPGSDATKPAILVCELAIAPQTLEEWRVRIEALAQKSKLQGLVRNEVVTTPRGERHVTLIEHAVGENELWVEHTVRMIAHRQLYSFILRADSETYSRASGPFRSMLDSIEFTQPLTGARLIDEAKNRWGQQEFKFALDLPTGWQPVLAPSEVALLFANGPAHGLWSDNCLLIAKPHGVESLEQMERLLPEQVKREDRTCEIKQCKRVPQGKIEALETIVTTSRGPFSITVVERRFRGDRFDYELKYTLETERLEALLPSLKASFESFEEQVGDVPGLGKST
jgi:hypothetical protein